MSGPVEYDHHRNRHTAEGATAGSEPRIPAVIHPECMRSACSYWRHRQSSLFEVIARKMDRVVRQVLTMKAYD